MFRLMSECVDDLCHAECETLEGLINMKVSLGAEVVAAEGEVLSVSEYLLSYGGYIEHVLS